MKNNYFRHTRHESGQTLVVLLVFMVTAITITAAATAVIMTNSIAASNIELGAAAYQIAESGAENALLRLLRDPNYTGEVLTVGDGSVTVVVSGTTTKTIVATATANNYTRKVQVTAGYVNTMLNVSSWQEVL